MDDNPENRAVLFDLLAPLGFEMTEASNGQEGVEKAREMQPDLILMDLIMPELDGLEATRQIRHLSPPLPVVILGISARAFEEDVQKSLEAGCDDFIAKPIDVGDVLEKLQQHLALEWVCGEVKPDEAAETAVPIVPPPPDELAAMIELARMGDISAIRQRADDLAREDDQLKPFATELNRLVKGFYLDEIRELLESLKGEK